MYLINVTKLPFFKLRIENSFYNDLNKSFFFYSNFFLPLKWFENYFNSINLSLYRKTYIHIIFNNLLFNQQGLKYLLTLPIKGQRTWSNGKSAKKNNLFLINYKINQFKNLLVGDINLNNLKNLIFINYFNWIWKLFWKKDWIYLYKKNKKLLKINLYSKAKTLTLNKLLNIKTQNKRKKIKNQIDLKIFFNFIGLESLIRLPK